MIRIESGFVVWYERQKESDSMAFVPSYINLFEQGELGKRIELLNELLKECRLCPRACGVNRLDEGIGYCKAPLDLMISSAFPHFGEEAPLVGNHGSGTIFLTHCNLRCIFCQNYDISHQGSGERVSGPEISRVMIRLQEMGCHNINFVTPTHYIPQILSCLPEAIQNGLRLPIVYNCSGYESLEVIELLEGIIDIYMPDAKYMDEKQSRKYSNAPDYPDVLKKALREMYRQVGDLRINTHGIAERGLLIRHLVMPNGVASPEGVLKFIAEEISVDSYVNIMAQYRPEYRAYDFPEISRRITDKEYAEALQIAKRLGLYRGF